MKPFRLQLKFGLLTGAMLIAYFLILGWLGVNTNPFYSFFNAVIFASCLSLALRSGMEETKGQISYRKGFEISFFTGIVATFVFSIFFITYYVYNPSFSEALLKNIGEFANTGGIFLTVVTMGIATSLVVSFALMQLHKKQRFKQPKKTRPNKPNH